MAVEEAIAEPAEISFRASTMLFSDRDQPPIETNAKVTDKNTPFTFTIRMSGEEPRSMGVRREARAKLAQLSASHLPGRLLGQGHS